MECSDCNKILNNEPVAYCEKCEEYYCMDCCYKHVNHGIVFFRYENKQLHKINVGVSGAGGGDIHDKFYEDKQWILTQKQCEHAESILENNKPLFFCEDGKIRCYECFYKDNLNLADPILKLYDKNEFMWLIPITYDPHDINFDIICDNEGIKGQPINLNIFIKNNKKYPITELCVNIESFANNVENYWWESDERNYLILTKVHVDSIDSGKEICIPLTVYIPLDGEVKEYDFVDFSFADEYYEFPKNIKKLNVPNNLKIFVSFSYKTYSGFGYYSYVKINKVKLK